MDYENEVVMKSKHNLQQGMQLSNEKPERRKSELSYKNKNLSAGNM